jgi:hypothetical protein
MRALVIAGLLLLGCGHARPHSPEDLDAAIAELDATLDAETILYIRQLERDDLSELHFGFGTSLRNRWGLWQGGRLARWFRRHGISHPEMISQAVIVAYWMHLHGERYELERVSLAKRWARRRHARREAKVTQKRALAYFEALDRSMRAAMAGWTVVDRNVPLALQPEKTTEWTGVRKIERDDAGFIVAFASGPAGPEAELYRVATSTWPLQHLRLDGCEEIHDVARIGDALHFICRTSGRWLLHTHAGDEELPMNSEFLRLGVDRTQPILFDERRVFTRSKSGWATTFTARPDTYNHVEKAPKVASWSMPWNADTAHLHGGFLYMWAPDEARGDGIWRLNLHSRSTELEHFGAFVPVYFSFGGSMLVAARAGGFWLTFGQSPEHTLVRWSPSATEIGVMLGSVDYPLQPSSDGFHVRDVARPIPASAVLEDDEGLWLAGPRGIARVRDGRVEPIVAFAHPPVDPYAEPSYTSIEPRALGRFDDGTFLIGDAHAGVYRLRFTKGGPRLEILE